MKRFTLALSAAALALTGAAAGAAYAQQHRMMADPMGDATVTRAEAQAKAAAMFDQHDVNRDGKLDQADRAAKIAQHFDQMDTNHDGAISKDEFTAAHMKPMGMRGEPGKMGPGHEGRGHGMGHRGMGMMGAMDANHDRTVTRDEFIAGALKRFDTADANHDGKLTKDERRAAFRAHMLERRGNKGKMGNMPATPAPAPAPAH